MDLSIGLSIGALLIGTGIAGISWATGYGIGYQEGRDENTPPF